MTSHTKKAQRDWAAAYLGKTDAYYESLTDPAHLVRLTTEAAKTPSGKRILGVCLGIARFLIMKNAAYGDSALNPLRIFSKAPAEAQILVRIDDKLSRLGRGHAAGEDAVLDLMGYLVLLMVSRDMREQAARESDVTADEAEAIARHHQLQGDLFCSTVNHIRNTGHRQMSSSNIVSPGERTARCTECDWTATTE